MKLAIMQPYTFPYIGYFQLINAVDKFVIYDDVQFIMGGLINRNNILINGKKYIFTIHLSKPSPNKLINEVKVVDDSMWQKKMLKTIKQSYKKATYFAEVYTIVERVFSSKEKLIGRIATHSILEVLNYLGISTEIVATSTNYYNNSLSRSERLVDICKKEGANALINPVGGRELYTKEYFKKRGIGLYFLKTKEFRYQQLKTYGFVPNLSIIDVLMFNSKQDARTLLDQYDLI